MAYLQMGRSYDTNMVLTFCGALPRNVPCHLMGTLVSFHKQLGHQQPTTCLMCPPGLDIAIGYRQEIISCLNKTEDSPRI